MAKGGRYIEDKDGANHRRVDPKDGDDHHAYPGVPAIELPKGVTRSIVGDAGQEPEPEATMQHGADAGEQAHDVES